MDSGNRKKSLYRRDKDRNQYFFFRPSGGTAFEKKKMGHNSVFEITAWTQEHDPECLF